MNYHAILVTAAWLIGEAAAIDILYLWSHDDRNQKQWVLLSILAILAFLVFACAVLAGVVK
jgi:hypothetical protein